MKVISKISCSINGQSRVVRISPGTLASRIYGVDEATEMFVCNYGFNEGFREQFANGALRIAGCDDEGNIRLVELSRHPFFVGTLFVPQMLSSPQKPHPLILAYLECAHRLRKSSALS